MTLRDSTRVWLARCGQSLLAARRDPCPWIEANLQIRSKDRRIIPLRFNWAQVDYYGHRTPRDVILKPRQLGFTTLVCGLFFADTLLRPSTTSVLVAHDLESAQRIFRIVQLFWDRLPAPEKRRAGKPRLSNCREFHWPRINSSFFVGTAGSPRFGHGLTVNNLHCSEVARWSDPEESLVALLEAVPADGRVILESTANGMGNPFHKLWTEAKSKANGFRPQFYVWWEDPTYRIAGPALTDLTAEERAFKERWKLDDDQMRWRRDKQRDLRERFAEQYPEDDVTCFLASGRCCFNTEALMAIQGRIAAASAPQQVELLRARTGDIPVSPARLIVWERPVEGRTYVIGADVGEGLAGGDASAACVLDHRHGTQVAELHGRVPPERFAQMLNLLGRWYNRALLAVERNNHGHSVLNTLRNVCGYPNLYYHVRYDPVGKTTPVLGWPTDQATKPILVDDLAAAIAAQQIVIRSSGLVDECLTFVTTDTGSQEAQPGAHDDRVMAVGIAWQARKRMVARQIAKRPAGW
jgi:hypothetical protein